MTKKHSGSPIKTGGSGAKDTSTGDHLGVGKHKQEGSTPVGTCPSDAGKYNPHSGHKIKD
jgi:hypothetical protein